MAVIAECVPRHRHQEFIGFTRTIEANVPKNLEIHCRGESYAMQGNDPQNE
jgi:putative transposase